MFSNQHQLNGTLHIQVYNSELQSYWQTSVKNIITTVGKQTLAKHFINTISGQLKFYIAVGTGTTFQSVNDTALAAQQAEILATPVFIEPLPANLQAVTVRVSAEVPALAAGQVAQALTEAGILLAIDGQVAKKLYNRVVFAPINRTQATTLNFAWDISF